MHYSECHPTTVKAELTELLQSRYQQDSKNFINGIVDKNFGSLDDSPFKIVVKKGGQPIYWNSTLNNYKEYKSKSHKSFTCHFYLDLKDPVSLRRFEKKASYDWIEDRFIPRSSITLKKISLVFFLLFLSITVLFILGPFLKSHPPLLVITGYFVAASVSIFVSVYLYGTSIFNLDSDLSIHNVLQLNTICIFLIYFASLIVTQGQRYISLFYRSSHKYVYQVVSLGISVLLMVGIIKLLNYFVISENIKFDYNNVLILDKSSIASLILTLILSILVYYTHYLLFKTSEHSYFKGAQNSLISLAAIILCTVVCLYGNYPIVPLLVFFIAYFLILELFVESSIRNITSMLWWLILYSAFISTNLFYVGLKNDIKTRSTRLAKLYSYPTDINHIKKISKDIIQLDLIYNLSKLPYPAKPNKSDFEDFALSLTQDIFQNSKWKIHDIQVFDQTRSSIFLNSFSDFTKIEKTIALSDRMDKNIYFHPFSNMYYLVYDISNPNYDDAPFTMYISLKNIHHDQEKSDDLNYVIITENHIVEKHLDVASTTISVKPESIKENTIVDDLSFVVHEVEDYRFVSFRKIAGLIKPISFFSFIFTLGGILLALFTYLNTKYSFLPQDIDLKYFTKSSLKGRIQLTIVLLIVFSFIIIGFITAIYFKTVFDTNQKNTRTKEIATIISSIESATQSSPDINAANEITSQKLPELANLHNVSLSFFNTKGQLVSQKNTNSAPTMVNYDILSKILRNKRSYTQYDDSDAYQTTYTPLRLSKNRRLRGILQVSYNKKDPTVRSIIDFVGTILNVYIFLFLLAGAISIAISNSITKPLSQLGDKLRKFKLGKENQSLEWSGNDEIGMLINDYNNLIEELAQSAALLAKTERDTAWREMAKQVAHEIKNPLTPMKLSIQYLEKAIKLNPENADQLIKRISSTLIEQIENLSQIASEFSNFAKMPSTNNEKVLLNQVVETIHDLFRKREDVQVVLHEPIEDMIVYADKNQLVRILNNLVKNALQAIPPDKKGKIEISLQKEGKRAKITVKDNGTGIPMAMQAKVFTPNFTTKNSGTGLGLAISANMIDTMDGNIYFETEENVGTSFHVELPLMRLEDDGNAIIL